MSASCPACGVAVVPGYVKCPKCHALLPRVTFKKGQAVEGAGGTSLEESSSSGLPVVPIALAVVVAVGIIAYFGLRKSGSGAAGAGSAADAGVGVTQPQQVAQPQQPVRGPDFGTQTPTTPTTPETPAGPRPDEVAKQLQRDLQRQQVFATVNVVPGSVLEVRSGSCADKAMKPTVEGFAATAHAAGLTRIRCVEQSGGVVFTREL